MYGSYCILIIQFVKKNAYIVWKHFKKISTTPVQPFACRGKIHTKGQKIRQIYWTI